MARYDLGNILNDYYNNDIDANPYSEKNFISNYYDFEGFFKELVSKKILDTHLSLNVQSLNSKFMYIKDLFTECKSKNININTFAMQELWQIPHPELFKIDGYSLYTLLRKNNRGGGVGFYVNSSFPCKILTDLTTCNEKIFECLTLEIVIDKKILILSNIYRSPSNSQADVDEFLLLFESHLNSLNKTDCPYLIFLDSNINLLKLINSNMAQSYLDLIHSNGFLQITRKATRIQNNSFSLIDHILTKNEPNDLSSGTIVSDLSDHFVNFVSLYNSKPVVCKINVKHERIFSLVNKTKFREALNCISWNNVLMQTDVNIAFDEFWSIFSSLYELHFPLTKIKFNKNIHKINNFMTTGLLTSRTNKTYLHKLYLKNLTVKAKYDYINYRNIYNRLIRICKKNYYADSLYKCKKNPKKTWDTYREILGLKGAHDKITEILKDGAIVSDDKEIAEEFNAYFTNVGKNISDSITKINIDPLSYIPMQDNLNELKFDKIGPILICDIVKAMDSKTSVDIDGISINLLKFILNSVSVPLAHIFDLSLKNGIFPNKLKSSRVVPVFKSGDRKICDNYRPISLVSSIAKILEKIVALKLTNHLEINKLFYPYQFGFQRGLSTEHNLLHLTNFVSSALNNNKISIGIFLDLKKAFDLVPHTILLSKLNKLGINNTALNWFSSYLSDRAQCVEINGKKSNLRSLNISVMQGSVLGPLLFLCFINDLYSSTSLLSLLFADDTCLLAAGHNLNELILYCNSELQKIANWFSSNQIAINVKKCKYIVFHNKGKKLDFENSEILFNLNEANCENKPENIFPLERVFNASLNKENQTYKYLGILIDENLTFNFHIDYICKKLSKSLFCLRRAKHMLDERGLLNLYYAFFHSHLLYCTNIFSCTTQANLNKVSILQKKAIRLVKSAKYNDHTAPLFKSLKILPFEKIIFEQRMKFMHSVYNNYAPLSFKNIWTLNANRATEYELRNSNDFTVQFPRYEGFKKYPLYSFAKIWNESGDLRLYNNRVTFCVALRDKLLTELCPDEH